MQILNNLSFSRCAMSLHVMVVHIWEENINKKQNMKKVGLLSINTQNNALH